MKKLLVVLLSVLLLFSFTSCEKDKSAEVLAEYEEKIKTQQEKNEELVKNFEDFMDAYADIKDIKKILVNCYDYDNLFRFQTTQGDVNIDLAETGAPKLEIADFTDFITLEDGQKVGGPSGVASDPVPSGYVTGIATGTSNYNLVYQNNKMTLYYAVYNGETQIKQNEKFEVTIDARTFKEVDNDDVHTVDYDITINTKTYQFSYTYDKKAKQVTAASVNGKTVEIRLINAKDADIKVN